MTVSTMIRLLRLRSVLAALALWPLALAGQATAVNGTLPEDLLPGLKTILAEAMNLAPRMLDQRITFAQAEAAKIQAASGLYPHLTGSSSYGMTRSASDTGNASSGRGFGYGVGISQSIFQEGSVKAAADVGKIGEQIAKNNYAEAYRTLLGTLRYQYLQLIYKKALLNQTRRQVETQKKELAYTQDNVARGLSAPDVLPAGETAVLAVQLAADRQTQDFENSRRLFARLAGQVAFAESAVPDAIPEARLPDGASAVLLANFLRGGVSDTPQAQTYALYLRQSELNYRTAKYVNYPKISLGLGYNNSANIAPDASGNVTTSFVTTQSASVGMSFTLFDAGSARAGKTIALNNRRMSERQLQTYIDTTRDEAENREKQVSFEYRAMELAARNLASAASALAVDKDYRTSGQRADLDVERSTTAYEVSEIAAFAARASFLQQWSDFVSLVGADPMMNQLPASYLNHGQ